MDACWAHDESLPKTRKEQRKQTLPGYLLGTNVPHFKIYHTIRLCEAPISYKPPVKPRAAYFPMKRLDFAKQSNTSWLFVANVPTLDFSDENRLCEAIELFKMSVNPRTAYFSEYRLEAAP